MKYLIPTFNCEAYGEVTISLLKNVKYKINSIKSKMIIFSNNTIPFLLELNTSNKNVLKVESKFDTFYFLFPSNVCSAFSVKFDYNSREVFVNISDKLCISINSELICEKIVENIKFSHFEIIGELCLIYFEGERNYLVVIKNKELLFASYYDECNIDDNEKYFMCKLNDSLNHGKVCCIKDKQFSGYLVYLDDEDLNLKNEFVPFVFLDCLKVENYKYANSLLYEDLRMEDEKQIKSFFPQFDYFYPISSREFVLINKNTLVGIFEFIVDNNEITNIMSR